MEKNKHQKLFRKTAIVLFVAFAMMFLSSCSFSAEVDQLLSPPRPSGENSEIEKALSDYVKTSNGEGPKNYTLKYPRSGDQRSAFMINPNNENEAVAFYHIGPVGNARINLLRKVDGEWKTIDDKEGASSDIDKVLFLDIDGDDVLEICVGWNLTTKDKRLSLYMLKDDDFREWSSEIYQEMVVADFTGDGKDSILTVYANSAEGYSIANLLGKIDDNDNLTIVTLGSVYLDGGINQFEMSHVTYDPVNGPLFFIDGLLSSGTVTELIYWDRETKQLVAPFYDAKTNTSITTRRDSFVPSIDIDRDTLFEWPITWKVVTFDEEDSSKAYKSEWYNWSIEQKEKVLKSTGIINIVDGYYFKYENSWKDDILAEYNTATKSLVLSIQDRDGERHEILVLQTLKNDDQELENSQDAVLEEDREMTELLKIDNVTYKVWFSKVAPTYFSKDIVKNLFVPLKDIM